jgi:hypothetical protein
MKNALAALLLVLVPGLARSAEVTRYATRVTVDPDGAGHAESTLVLAGGPSETLVIPLSHGSWANLRLVEATAGLLLEPSPDKAATIRVTLPPAASAPSRLVFAFDVPGVFAKPEVQAAVARPTMPGESRMLRYAFVNSQVTLIRDFRVLVTLPEGARFQAIREQLPKQTKSEVEPRVRLGGENGRQNALLSLANLGQGDDTSMQLEVVPGRRSLLWLVAGLVLSALYLVHFRDLVFPKPPPVATR